MTTVHIEKGILEGKDLEVWDATKIAEFARSEQSTELSRVAFYSQKLERGIFRGVNFKECSFARSRFVGVNFRRCTFENVDLTRAVFRDCHFSDCVFKDSDPYNASFVKTVVEPAAFRRCYKEQSYNKALILFANLRVGFERAGDLRLARAAEYYYRLWERRRLYHLWRDRATSDITPWLASLLLGSLTGYGERPAYLGAWVAALITLMAAVYRRWFPIVVTTTGRNFGSYWYFSFKVFCAQGFTSDYAGAALLVCQVSEFVLGLIFISMLVGSVSRKLS